jgi:hypothetical protein
VLGFDVSTATEASIRVIANLGREFLPLPDAAEVLVASGDVDPERGLGTDTAVWLRIS